MYITECVGVEFVGVSVIIWGMSTCLGSFVSGWLIRYTTSYIIVTAVLVVGHIGSTVFLLVWVRQPSLEVIGIMAAIFGLCHGVIFAAALGEYRVSTQPYQFHIRSIYCILYAHFHSYNGIQNVYTVISQSSSHIAHCTHSRDYSTGTAESHLLYTYIKLLLEFT